MAARFEVQGLPELNRILKRVPESVQPKIVAQSLRAALKPMLNAARSNAPQGDDAHRTYKGRLVAPGFLKRNIKLKKLRRRDKRRTAYAIYATGESFYGQFVERGIAGTGRVQANPWLGKAWDDHKDNVERDFMTEQRQRIERALRGGKR